MESNSGEKSRREKRKEARMAKQQQRHLSWIEHQKSSKLKRETKRKISNKSSSKVDNNGTSSTCGSENLVVSSEREDIEYPISVPKKSKVKVGSSGVSKTSKVAKGNKGLKGKSKTKFEEYIEMETKKGVVSAEEDLALEKKLAKRLRLKNGKLGGVDDGMDMLFEGLPSLMDTSVNDKEFQNVEEEVHNSPKLKATKKRKRRKLASVPAQDVEVETEGNVESDGLEEAKSNVVEVANGESCEKAPTVAAAVKYLAPHLRARAGNESEENTQLRRQVRGLLNRLSESNVESITGEISTILRSVSRHIGSQIVSEEVLASCSGGPRGNQQHAAVFAAFVAGLACMVGIDFSAKVIASLAKCFEDEYSKEDNLSMRNLTLLLSYLCIFGVCSSDLIYDFLIILSKRLMEVDVSTILTILECCGMKLRSDDPAAMKEFIVSIQNRVAELKSATGNTSEDQPKINNKRMEFMLETICDIKNNKKKSKEDPTQHTRIKKWLQKLMVEDILLRGLKWNKLLDPNKKGQWWLSGEVASATGNVEGLASTIDKEVLEAQKMLQLAAAQRMNTDSRRAIFCIVMSGEDYIDAFEKLLRLDLNGKQDREIMRVLVECCLQERVFNKYYTVLASKLCNHDKNHKFTLQYCLWDHFKELESMELIRSKNLARFVAEMFASFSLSIAVLKTVDLSDPNQLTPKRIMHFRMLFDAIFEQPDSTIWNIFTRVAITPELESMRSGIEFFIKHYVVTSNKALSSKFKIAKKALSNVTGVLM